MHSLEQLVELLDKHGDSQYGGEAVTQLEHALQAAMLAENEGADAELIAAALLHDVGHLLHNLPENAPDIGIDDHHENSARRFLSDLFPPQVTEPIRLHVAAKRYLCTVDPQYIHELSQPSIVSFNLQGGLMSPAEVAEFEKQPCYQAAVRLRRWDDAAKVAHFATPPLTHFVSYLQQAAAKVTSP